LRHGADDDSMNGRASHRSCRRLAACLFALCLTGCIYDAPITPAPTRPVDPRLIGDWASADGKERVKVRPLDRQVYIIVYNGDLFRAFHSDVGGVSYASVQDIDRSDRKWAYIVYTLSRDGQQLTVRAVNSETIPDRSVRSPADARRALAAHAKDPKLFGDEPLELQRQKP
jgi:hypothetical protein